MRLAPLLAAALVASLPLSARAQADGASTEAAPGAAAGATVGASPAVEAPPAAQPPAPPPAAGVAPATVAAIPGPVAEAPPPAGPKPLSFGVWGALPFGEHLATAITPKDAAYQVNEPDRSWGFGILMEYAVSPSLRVFLDGGMYSQSVQVAKQDGYGTSFWVYEQTGYTTHDVGPFDANVRYYMDTTALRIGGSYVVPLGSLRAWIGGTVGLYAWQATYGTDDRTGKWGQVSGKSTGFTIMMGTDLPLTDAVTAGIFADLASPAANVEMKDLFNPGWTWSTGHHVMGPYRVGIRLLTTM